MTIAAPRFGFLSSLLGATALLHVAASLRAEGDLPAMRAEVTYHFRERLPEAKPGEKAVSAPGTETERLPAAQFVAEKGRRVIEGRVPHLPYTFYVRLSRPATPGAEPLLECNVVDPRSGHALSGFPKRSEHPVSEGIVSFEVPLDEAAKRQAAKVLRNKLEFITYVDVLVRF